ncbi:hypothetical protein FRX31_014319 [Thalictrum thalictroides]|uniref:Serine/arginine repetitive matrix protein n=1 Tax=Thalictrum thalictroides TaxID=46969 RepID=A0A7J6WGI4_THATH|nr:hypothetical protein FRX31_014319 [Thalictrum thalictroides]
MGCCFSKSHGFNNTPPPLTHPHFTECDPSTPPLPRFKPPLSPVFEEETVKEVLSETPNPKPILIPKSEPKSKPPSLLKIEEEVAEEKKEDEEKQTKIPTTTTVMMKPSVSKIGEKEEEDEKKENVSYFEEISEVSEIYSLSESISTTTITEKKEDEDGEVVQPLRVQRSPAKVLRKRSIPGDFVGKHERGCKSPARRLNPSPGRRNEHNNNSEIARRRLPENNNGRVMRRDLGERSGRRSRSPATRANSGNTRAGIGRSPSRKSPRSPARVPAVVTPENSRKEEETKDANKSTNESIENPLVSLECFIFL